QVLLPRLKNDLVDLLEATIDGTLARHAIELHENAAVCVVMASGGYPGRYATGVKISGLDALESAPDLLVFHAGTDARDGGIVTAGGRVLGVTALGPDIAA